MKIISAIALVLLTAGCATIKSYETVAQPVNKINLASVGTVIFRLDKTADLPNVLGKADIYGGKVSKGFTEVRLVSVEGKDKFTLGVRDVVDSSTENTLDRYGSGGQFSVKISRSPYSNVSIDFSTVKQFPISGYIIQFNSFDGLSLSYTIVKQ